MACTVKYLTLTLISIFFTFAMPLAQARTVRAEVVASNLQNPWAVAFLPEGRFLVTERPGRLRVIEPNGEVGEPVLGLPSIAAQGQGGLLDVLLDTDFVNNSTLYFCFSEPGQVGNSTALAKARLSPDRLRLEDLKIIFTQKPKVVSSAHFGCRIVESQTNGKSDGMLYLTLGDRYSQMNDAQTLNNHHGKIVRIYKDGRVPDSNPFVKRFGALPEIWSYGHRNLQGAVLSTDGSLWTHEHGPQGGDEINLVLPGRNYGWPVITYGENYGGGKIGLGLTSQKGMEQPLHYWVPSIAPSGMVFLSSERYGRAWVGNLFVGSLKFAYLNRVELSQPFGGKAIKEHKLLEDLGQRIRDVRQGPDGWLYVLTDNTRGQLIRLVLK
jgi:glucose/arabinose dehydrogenase